ncbi:P-II family nitrogen regulator [Candidatus Izemoplasma sp. B36]|uniref:P-II family nitrogen regulator n=1 Tax=Candidatus Izemoplasma sp. B36 TaxID=3242468 RepID=UPI0035575983
MKLVVYVMNKTELLEEFLHELKEKNIKGATILNSSGMARKLIQNDDMEFIGSLKTLFDNPRKESHVILIAVPDQQTSTVYKVIDTVCGDLSEPNTGIVFTLSIEEIKGYIG